jgi:hypothetical protein
VTYCTTQFTRRQQTDNCHLTRRGSGGCSLRLRRSRRRFRDLDLCPSRDPDLCRSRLRRCSPSPIKREAILSSGSRVSHLGSSGNKCSRRHGPSVDSLSRDLRLRRSDSLSLLGDLELRPCTSHRNCAAQFNLDSLCTKGSCVAGAGVDCTEGACTTVLVRLTIVRTSN